MYTPADTLTPDALAALFTRGYAGYVVPVHLNAEQMQSHITNNDIDLSASQVAHVDGEAVGVCLLGIRGQRGWIGGVGVAEMHRRHGIGRGLMQAVHTAARERGMTHIQLEVLTPNENAKRLYEALGYQVTRRLLIIEAAAPPNNASTQDDHTTRQVYAVTPSDALAHYDAFHAVANPWQRASESLRHLPADMPVWVALVGDAPAAYAIARITAQAVQWLDVACAPDQHDALRGLLQHIHQQHPLPARLVNLDAQDAAWGVLESLGYRETLAQWEMVLQLETL